MPTGKLVLTNRKLAYADSSASSNPKKRYFDWGEPTRSLDVQNPKEVPYTLSPGETKTIFSGTVSTGIGANTEFDLTISPISSSTYRFTWSGAGQDPVLRTDRGLSLGSSSVTVASNNNQTVSFTGSAGDFTAVVVGDTLFIPGVTTGDAAGPFNSLNEGLWTVISKDGTSAVLQLQRPSGTGFSAFGETVNVVTDDQVLAYSSAGVQVGDSVVISAGFSTSVQGTYDVTAVTPGWFEVQSTLGLPVAETAVPTASGMIFYDYSVSWLYLETDQLMSVRLNGDTGDFHQVKPVVPGDDSLFGYWEGTSAVYSLTIVNKSNSTLNLKVFSTE